MEQPAVVELSEEQAESLRTVMAAVFPSWRIWRAHGIWYATGPCSRPHCRCTRTLHGPNADSLIDQLATATNDDGREAVE
jgi:hypothetical protein